MMEIQELKNAVKKFTLKDAREWADIVIENIENTEKSWSENSLNIMNSEGAKKLIIVDFSSKAAVRLNDKDDEEPTDITLNLQYFFPICDRVLFNSHENEIIFVVKCKQNDKWRVRNYLGIQNQVKQRLCICTIDVEKADIKDGGKISPIDEFIVDNVDSVWPLMCIGQRDYVNCEHIDRNQFRDDLTVKILSESYNGFEKYIIDETEVKMNQYLKCPQYRMLLEIGRKKIDGINEKLLGKGTSAETLEKGKTKKKKFWQIIHRDKGMLKRHSLLTQLIWISVLFSFLEQEELQIRDLGKQSFSSKVYILLWDAIAYSEGILQLLENSELHSQHHTGYLSVCIHKISLKQLFKAPENAARRVKINRKYRVNQSDSFINRWDGCCIEFNVIDMGRDKENKAQGIEVKAEKELSQLFKGEEQNDIDQIAHHYGLPLFYEIVVNQNGRYICSTPHTEQTAKRYFRMPFSTNRGKPEYEEIETQQVWTEYQILLPMTKSYQLNNRKTKPAELFDSSLLKDGVLTGMYKQKLIEIDKILEKLNLLEVPEGRAERKIGIVNQIHTNIEEAISSDSIEINRTVLEVKFNNLILEEFELVIKGLFVFMANRTQKSSGEKNSGKNNGEKIWMRLIFGDEIALSEALRRFSIFYRRGENIWMENIQIAMCVIDGDNSPQEESCVRFILAGKDIYEAYITAKQYMYNNTNVSSGFLLSQIEYLVSTDIGKSKDTMKETILNVPLFPFDLVKNENGKSDFQRQIMRQLEGNFQEKAYGCKISNAHVLLGSKIHLKDFYDAELLFQNISNIYRFSYLLAGDIYNKLDQSKKPNLTELYLVGDEKHSGILLSETKRILETIYKHKLSVKMKQFIKGDDNQDQIVPNLKNVEKVIANDCAIVIIMPIGTTLKTIYRIKNVFLRQYKLPEDTCILGNYTLILVEDETENSESVKRYWITPRNLNDKEESEKLKDDCVILQPEIAKNGDLESRIDFKVKSYFRVKNKWMLPEKCELCGNNFDENLTEHIPFCQVDKTSTMPGLLFPLKEAKPNHGIGFSCREQKSKDSLEQMKECVMYGHIRRDANHYQYFINYARYYEKVQNECIKWLQTLRNDISENEFNIIISPLKRENNQFLKDVVDHVFQHSLRFICLSLDQVYREEIRSRFSYIAQEYEEACKGTELPRYNVYFVDYSMVMGQTLRRSEMLIKMLMNEVEGEKDIHIFRKVILLTNRSSFDTAAVFVQNPKDDFVAFSTLKIPSYNTVSDRCPACELVDKYQTIAKCSATNEIYWYYQSLVEKHKVHDYDCVKKEMEKLYYSEPRYLQNFCQYLYLMSAKSTEAKNSKTVKQQKSSSDDCKLEVLKYIEQIIKNGDIANSEWNLNKVERISNEDWKKQIKKCFEEYISERNWRRLLCTHQAVNLIEKLAQGKWEVQEVRNEIWKVIAEGTLGAEEKAEQREWFISYIKAFSREYPAKLAPIRRGIYTLMELFLSELLETNKEVNKDKLLKNWKSVIDTENNNEDIKNIRKIFDLKECQNDAEVLQLYQMYLVMAKRLCDLQSNLLLQFNVLKKIDTFVKTLKEKNGKVDYNTGDTLTIVFPDNNKIRMHYLQLVKWTIMSNKDESKAFMLQKLCDAIVRDKENNENKKNNENKEEQEGILNDEDFVKIMNLENTRVLYTGIKIINLQVETDGKSDEDVSCEIKKLLEGVKDNSEYYYQNALVDLVRFFENDLKKEEAKEEKEEKEEKWDKLALLLTYLLKLYQIIIKLDENNEVEKEKSYVEDYSKLCFYISRIGEYENCCMIHRSNNSNEIVAKYFSDDIENVNDAMDQIIDRTIDDVSGTHDTLNLGRTVYTDKETGALVLTLRIRRNVSVAHLQTVYIIMFDQEGLKKTTVDEKQIKTAFNERRASYILFMRQRLQVVLERDLYALYHFKSGLEDVQWISESKEELCLLHLTDLHVSVYNQENISKLIKSHEESLKAKNPELMLVTGDVVQGTGSGIDLEENYKYAAKILKQIANILWKGEDGKIRDDWKKRIIIIPGNHDYASMNELIANHTLRATTGGVPVLRDGTPMSKYSYYIQFLQDFLGIETRLSIERNLNSFLEYPNLKLRIIALNSVAEIGPIRNNKMQLDEDFIKYVCNKRSTDNLPDTGNNDEEYFTIALAHHTRCYKPDYFYDRYKEKEVSDEIVALMKRLMSDCYKNTKQVLIYKNQGDMSKANSIIENGKKQVEQYHEKYEEEWNVFGRECNKSVLYNDANYIFEHWHEITNERCTQIFADFERNNNMARRDWEIYQERLKLLERHFPFKIMLGGHTHRAGKTKELNCIEGGRFYDPSSSPTKLNFGRVLIKRSHMKTSFSYEFSDKKSVVEIDDQWENTDEKMWHIVRKRVLKCSKFLKPRSCLICRESDPKVKP